MPGPSGLYRKAGAYIWRSFTAIAPQGNSPVWTGPLGHMPPAGKLSTGIRHWEASMPGSLLLLASRPKGWQEEPRKLALRQNTSGGPGGVVHLSTLPHL